MEIRARWNWLTSGRAQLVAATIMAVALLVLGGFGISSCAAYIEAGKQLHRKLEGSWIGVHGSHRMLVLRPDGTGCNTSFFEWSQNHRYKNIEWQTAGRDIRVFGHGIDSNWVDQIPAHPVEDQLTIDGHIGGSGDTEYLRLDSTRGMRIFEETKAGLADALKASQGN